MGKIGLDWIGLDLSMGGGGFIDLLQ